MPKHILSKKWLKRMDLAFLKYCGPICSDDKDHAFCVFMPGN